MTAPIPAPEGCRYGIEPEQATPDELENGTLVFRTSEIKRRPPLEDIPAHIWCYRHLHWTEEGAACVIPDYGKEERT